MSECVVRMEMPESCEKCPACDYEEGNCLLADDRNTLPHNRKRRSWCPIICQLPEGHGRLVDADAYSAEMKDRQDAAWNWRNEAIGEEDEVKLARAEGAFTAFVEAKLTWDKQATIVPAEAERSET